MGTYLDNVLINEFDDIDTMETVDERVSEREYIENLERELAQEEGSYVQA